eukprot:TRINITY_DN570_c0_g3_i1.p1 TRINITY_DN570_c0_g3~~TRINITY_DN570_c0_g3_i1.p1  ORF type:complete len:780 (+),score=270.23 TRINITY_DN570_c0_g3_i1:97-2436(+)
MFRGISFFIGEKQKKKKDSGAHQDLQALIKRHGGKIAKKIGQKTWIVTLATQPTGIARRLGRCCVVPQYFAECVIAKKLISLEPYLLGNVKDKEVRYGDFIRKNRKKKQRNRRSATPILEDIQMSDNEGVEESKESDDKPHAVLTTNMTEAVTDDFDQTINTNDESQLTEYEEEKDNEQVESSVPVSKSQVKPNDRPFLSSRNTPHMIQKHAGPITRSLIRQMNKDKKKEEAEEEDGHKESMSMSRTDSSLSTETIPLSQTISLRPGDDPSLMNSPLFGRSMTLTQMQMQQQQQQQQQQVTLKSQQQVTLESQQQEEEEDMNTDDTEIIGSTSTTPRISIENDGNLQSNKPVIIVSNESETEELVTSTKETEPSPIVENSQELGDDIEIEMEDTEPADSDAIDDENDILDDFEGYRSRQASVNEAEIVKSHVGTGKMRLVDEKERRQTLNRIKGVILEEDKNKKDESEQIINSEDNHTQTQQQGEEEQQQQPQQEQQKQIQEQQQKQHQEEEEEHQQQIQQEIEIKDTQKSGEEEITNPAPLKDLLQQQQELQSKMQEMIRQQEKLATITVEAIKSSSGKNTPISIPGSVRSVKSAVTPSRKRRSSILEINNEKYVQSVGAHQPSPKRKKHSPLAHIKSPKKQSQSVSSTPKSILKQLKAKHKCSHAQIMSVYFSLGHLGMHYVDAALTADLRNNDGSGFCFMNDYRWSRAMDIVYFRQELRKIDAKHPLLKLFSVNSFKKRVNDDSEAALRLENAQMLIAKHSEKTKAKRASFWGIEN